MATLVPAPREPHVTSEVLERVRDLAPFLAKRSPAIEREKTIPDDVLDALREAGVLRMAVPAEYGGADLSLPAAVSVIEELTRADGSAGWVMGQVALAHVVFGYLPASALEAIYAAGPDVYAAGAAAPKGRAAIAGDGLTVSGRWPLVSGCRHASWLYLQCLVETGEASTVAPRIRAVVVPAGAVRILETYRGLGLRGSGSHDVHVSGLAVPAERCVDLTGPAAAASAICRIPAAAQAGLVAAGVMIGTAAGALDAVLALAVNKRPAFSTQRLADSVLFQDAAGEAYTTLAAARWLLRSELDAADAAAARAPVSAAADARLRAVATKVAALALEVVDCAYTLGGSSSVAEGSPLERRLRDARSLSQHATLAAANYTRLGAVTVSA